MVSRFYWLYVLSFLFYCVWEYVWANVLICAAKKLHYYITYPTKDAGKDIVLQMSTFNIKYVLIIYSNKLHDMMPWSEISRYVFLYFPIFSFILVCVLLHTMICGSTKTSRWINFNWDASFSSVFISNSY